MTANTVRFNSIVLLHYALLSSGNLFETTFGKDPMKITIGDNDLPQIIEASLYGLKCGDKKEYSFNSMDIFGKYDKDKVVSTPLKTFKNYKDVKTGDIIEIQEENKSYFMTVMKITGDEVLVDLNHPLCNKDVKFKVEILEINNDS